MCRGLAEFENDLTVDIQEANACNVNLPPTSYITGSKGALTWWNIDEVGGDWSMGQGPENIFRKTCSRDALYRRISRDAH